MGITTNQALSIVKSCERHVRIYRKQERELLALAKLAAEHEKFDEEHAYRREAAMKKLCASLVERAALQTRECLVEVAKTVLQRLGIE